MTSRDVVNADGTLNIQERPWALLATNNKEQNEARFSGGVVRRGKHVVFAYLQPLLTDLQPAVSTVHDSRSARFYSEENAIRSVYWELFFRKRGAMTTPPRPAPAVEIGRGPGLPRLDEPTAMAKTPATRPPRALRGRDRPLGVARRGDHSARGGALADRRRLGAARSPPARRDASLPPEPPVPLGGIRGAHFSRLRGGSSGAGPRRHRRGWTRREPRGRCLSTAG